MTDKQIFDRLSGINMSIAQKQALIDVIKDIAGNNTTDNSIPDSSNDNDVFNIDIDTVNSTINGYPIESLSEYKYGTVVGSVRSYYMKQLFDDIINSKCRFIEFTRNGSAPRFKFILVNNYKLNNIHYLCFQSDGGSSMEILSYDIKYPSSQGYIRKYVIAAQTVE